MSKTRSLREGTIDAVDPLYILTKTMNDVYNKIVMSVKLTYECQGKVEHEIGLSFERVEELPEVLKEAEERINLALSEMIAQQVKEDV